MATSSNRPLLNRRLAGLGTTIFAEMSALALTTGSVNLGQGFPDTDGPAEVAAAAAAAIMEGRGNQYPPGPGIPELRHAVAAHQKRFYGVDLDPDTEVLVTAGATEGIAAALIALMEPGDEAIAFEPYYDSYAACVAMAGAARVPVTLRPPDFRPDLAALRAAITPRTRLILLNTPHNPTGAVFSRAELTGIAALACEHDLLVVSDEVYEHLIFDGRARADRHPARDARAHRDDQLRGQDVLLHRLEDRLGDRDPGTGHRGAHGQAVPHLRHRRAVPVRGGPGAGAARRLLRRDQRGPAGQARPALRRPGRGGVRGVPAAGTYFVTTDIRPLGETDGMDFCRRLPGQAGVVAIPSSVFYDNESAGRSQVRFAFCKKDEVLRDAIARLAARVHG